MALCGSFSNITIGCDDKKQGGIKTVYVAEYAAITGITYNADADTVTGITMTSGSKFYEYQFVKNSGSFIETSQVSTENNTIFYQPEIQLQFSKQEVVKRNQFKQLAQTDVVAIVLTNAGKYWLVGSGKGLTLSAGSSEAGKASADFNGYRFTLTGDEPDLAYEVPESLIAGLLEEH